jgi:endonuclease/exonuclease/phosphatase family metal-dependent hydrolase
MRVATFNIQSGRSADGTVRLDRFRDAVRMLDADILALQEVDRDQPRSQLADFTALAAEVMGAVADRFVAAVAGTPGASWVAATADEPAGTPVYGIALLSRYPAARWQVLRLPRLPIRVPLRLPDTRKVTVVREEPRVAVVGHFDTPAGRLAVANTHLSFVPGWNRVQLRHVGRALATLSDPTVLTGDLNMTRPVVRGYRSVASGLTFPSHAPNRQLDHVLVRGASQPETVATPEAGLSDHLPLVVTFQRSGDGRH